MGQNLATRLLILDGTPPKGETGAIALAEMTVHITTPRVMLVAYQSSDACENGSDDRLPRIIDGMTATVFTAPNTR